MLTASLERTYICLKTLPQLLQTFFFICFYHRNIVFSNDNSNMKQFFVLNIKYISLEKRIVAAQLNLRSVGSTTCSLSSSSQHNLLNNKCCCLQWSSLLSKLQAGLLCNNKVKDNTVNRLNIRPKIVIYVSTSRTNISGNRKSLTMKPCNENCRESNLVFLRTPLAQVKSSPNYQSGKELSLFMPIFPPEVFRPLK